MGQDSWKAGYLPYSIIDRYEQLAKDLAYWRVLSAAEANPAGRPTRPSSPPTAGAARPIS